jgi:hypothetical protein
VTQTQGPREFDYLRPLFEKALQFRGENHTYLALPPPQPHSSLAADDEPLQGWNCSLLISASLTAGIAHVDALARLVMDTQTIDNFSPWTLLRASLENFAVATWLLSPTARVERRRRALSLWAEDMRNRQQHESDTRRAITGSKEKSGSDRRAELLQRASAWRRLGGADTHWRHNHPGGRSHRA